jgi:hypothetical protein
MANEYCPADTYRLRVRGTEDSRRYAGSRAGDALLWPSNPDSGKTWGGRRRVMSPREGIEGLDLAGSDQLEGRGVLDWR